MDAHETVHIQKWVFRVDIGKVLRIICPVRSRYFRCFPGLLGVEAEVFFPEPIGTCRTARSLGISGIPGFLTDTRINREIDSNGLSRFNDDVRWYTWASIDPIFCNVHQVVPFG